MMDLEQRLRRGLDAAAATQEVPAGFDDLVSHRVSVVRRRRVVGRGALVALALALVVGGVAALRPDSSETTVTGGSGPGVSTEPGWRPIADAPISPRFQAQSIAMGDRVLIWGGSGSDPYADSLLDGAVYDTAHDSWAEVPDAPLTSGDAIGAWTGREAIVLSGDGATVAAAAYDPAANTWRKLATPPLTNAASALNHALWTGTELVVVGIANQSDNGTENQVAIYDPERDQWRTGSVPSSPLPSFGDAVWTGTEIAVAGEVNSSGRSRGNNSLLAYNPATDRWREIPWGLDGIRNNMVIAWTGSHLFIGGGYGPPTRDLAVRSRDAALVDLATGTWDRVPDAPIGFEGNTRFGELWTGTAVLTLNGEGDQPVSFDPAARTWTVGPPSGEGFRRDEVSWAWVEPRGAALVWSGGLSEVEASGVTGCCTPIDRGRIYQPAR